MQLCNAVVSLNIGGYMQTVTEQACLFCQNNAEYEFTAHRLSKYFECETCGKFAVAVDAERIVLGLTPESRSALSAKAKESNIGHVFTIRLAHVDQQLGRFGLTEKHIEKKLLAKYFY